MFLSDIFIEDGSKTSHKLIRQVAKDCSLFLEQSNCIPFFKDSPIEYQDVQKVKVRIKKNKDIFTQTFNEAFNNIAQNIKPRSVMARNYHDSFENPSKESFYVFIPNGFSFISTTKLSEQLKLQNTFNNLIGQTNNNDSVREIMTEVISMSYRTDETLSNIVLEEREVLFFNIPYFYTIRAQTYPEYDKLLSLMK
jgi:hypothetical protein